MTPDAGSPSAESVDAGDAGFALDDPDAAGADATAFSRTTMSIATKLSVSGAMDAVAVKAIVARHKALFTACFAMVTFQNPGFRGRALFSFTIEADGRVGIARLEVSTFGDGRVESCVLRQLRSITFPIRDSPTNVVAFPVKLAGTTDGD